MSSPRSRYALAYARLRASEGRGGGGERELLALPYLESGAMSEQWRIRARTYEAFLARVLEPAARRASRPLSVLDLGAGNGWLCFRLSRRGHRTLAVDLRYDDVDGLASARAYGGHLPRLFPRVAASFDALPLRSGLFDVIVFNASLHYAESLARVLAEARRVLAPRGLMAILDSPFYARAETGEAMVEEKKASTRQRYAALADDLLAVPGIEFLTRERLGAAAGPLGLSFRRHRVLYPWAYEKRPLVAAWNRKRPPSRFDLWVAEAP